MLLSPKGFLRLASACVGFMLFIVACMGFNTMQLTVYSVDSQAEFGCLCFLGVCFGLLLTFGESTWETFFFFFGFMRYRLGRASILIVSGIMVALLGKTRDKQCNCNDNAILIVEGIALLVIAGLQILAIFVFGNNSAPRNNSPQAIRVPEAAPLPVTAPRNAPLPKENASYIAVVQPIPSASIPVAAPQVQASPAVHDSNMPSWMNTP